MLQRFKNIIKPLHDSREYRGLILPNGLKVLLISDKTAEKGAAALNVHVGHMSDPDELPGLAHFCEHMLFLGTKKYPVENDYKKFIAQHGGMCNASTSTSETKFMFEVGPEHLNETLDRFAQFFIAPLFTESAAEREINAVDSEHMKNIPDDSRRFFYLRKFLCDSSHPYHKFGTGNKQTLLQNPKAKGINVREALVKFHNQWYSANIMTLAILGQEPLDELEVMSEKYFGSIENKKIKAPMWKDHPYTSEQFATITTIIPVKDIRVLSLYFPFPDLRPYYKSAPDVYLSHLCGHEGAGSILSILKSLGWSSYIASGVDREFGFSFFVINVDLTKEGLDHIDKIVELVFQYISLLRRDGVQQWIFEECCIIRNMHFAFKEHVSPFQYVYNIVSNIIRYPFEQVLYGPYNMSEYNPDLIKTMLKNCVPEKMRVYVIAKKPESGCNLIEPLYGIKYCTEKISNEMLKTFKEACPDDNLKLPVPNEFIPNNFDMMPLENETPHPVIVLDTEHTRLWFKQDSQFRMPKLNIIMILSTPLAYLDPLCCNLAYMFAQLFQDSFTEYSYAATLAGLDWHTTDKKRGIVIALGGFSNKTNVLLNKILIRIKNFKIDCKKFTIIRDSYIRLLQNFQMEQPYIQSTYYTDILLAERSWTREELLQACVHTTPENLEIFLPQLLSKLHVEVLIHGNCNQTQALDIGKLVMDSLKLYESPALYAQQMLNSREHKLEPGSKYMFSADHKYHRSSCASLLYQCGPQETANNVLLELLVQILQEPCFRTLRTKEQLGYIVFCVVRRSNGTQGLRILVQSERPPSYLDYRIEAFIDEMKLYLESICQEEFERLKGGLALQRLEKSQSLSETTSIYWTEISSQQYHFNRSVEEVACLKNLTKSELISFYTNQIESCGANRRKLAVYIKSKIVTPNLEKTNIEHPIEKYKKITDTAAFKNSKELFPLVTPYINISKKGVRS